MWCSCWRGGEKRISRRLLKGCSAAAGDEGGPRPAQGRLFVRRPRALATHRLAVAAQQQQQQPLLSKSAGNSHTADRFRARNRYDIESRPSTDNSMQCAAGQGERQARTLSEPQTKRRRAGRTDGRRSPIRQEAEQRLAHHHHRCPHEARVRGPSSICSMNICMYASRIAHRMAPSI